MSKIEMSEVVIGTDLVDRLLPNPRTPVNRHRTARRFGGFTAPTPLPEAIKPEPLKQAVFGIHDRCPKCLHTLTPKEVSLRHNYKGECESCAKTASCGYCGKAIQPTYSDGREKKMCDAHRNEVSDDFDDEVCEICEDPDCDYTCDDMEDDLGVPTAEQEFTTEPLNEDTSWDPAEERYGTWLRGRGANPIFHGGFGQEKVNVVAALVDAPMEPHGDLVAMTAEEAFGNGTGLTDLVEEVGLAARVHDLASDQIVMKRGPFQAPEMARPASTSDDVTDAERRDRAADIFGINRNDMTDNRLEGLS